jgi:hypothetical protein
VGDPPWLVTKPCGRGYVLDSRGTECESMVEFSRRGWPGSVFDLCGFELSGGFANLLEDKVDRLGMLWT